MPVTASHLKKAMQREPLVTVASVTGIVTAVVAALVAFGVSLTEQQQGAILGLAAVAAPFVVAYFARKRVTPTAKVETYRDEAGQSALYVALVVLVVLAILAVIGVL